MEAAEFSRSEIQGKPQRLGAANFTLLQYWPDFVITNGKPGSATMLPNNPAVLVRLDAPRLPRPGESPKPLLEMTPAPDGIAYQLSRGGFLSTGGNAKIGEPFVLGWADWSATVTQSLPDAKFLSEREPAAAGQIASPGFRARLVASDGTRGEPSWVGSGDTVTLSAGAEKLRFRLRSGITTVPFTTSPTESRP